MSAQTTILIADRDPNALTRYQSNLQLAFPVMLQHADDRDRLYSFLQNGPVDILVVDTEFCEDEDILTFLQRLRQEYPEVLLVPTIPSGNQQLLKSVLELDLVYFLHKPLDPLETTLALKRACDAVADNQLKKKKAEKPPEPFHGMIGATPVMRQLFDLIARIAEDDQATVLIRGESGTGKEMIAKAIHASSPRKKKNFVPVNCAAIPDDLLESELFGYTKGAFTGANSNKQGRIQYADQGTLFLDEIGDMKASLQAKLLRVLQEKEFEPVGGFKSIPVNTRILAATHCDLETLVANGEFREDLYYRLSVVPVVIPPLRERLDDLPLLIDGFLGTYADKRGRERFEFSTEAMEILRNYAWKGNVRELENLIQHMSILFSGNTVHPRDLPEKFHDPTLRLDANMSECDTQLQTPQPVASDTTTAVAETDKGNLESNRTSRQSPMPVEPPTDGIVWEEGKVDFNALINRFETELIIQALKQTSGNKKEAAKLLNLKRTTLLEKIKKKAIDGLWEEQ